MRKMFSEKQIKEMSKQVADERITTLVEGGTLDNAKPLYFHPITVTQTNKASFNAIIIDNNPEAYNTWDKFKAKMLSIASAIEATARFPITGAYVTSASKIMICGNIDALTTNSLRIFGLSVEGESIYEDITNLIPASVFDGVNKIN